MDKMTYLLFTDVTKDILNTIRVGDMVKFNNDKRGTRVFGVSENYFVAANRAFGKWVYSVCEKKRATHSHNAYTAGCFNIAGDDYIFGAFDGYHFDDAEWCKNYLEEFEVGQTHLSVRSAVPVLTIEIKHAQHCRPTCEHVMADTNICQDCGVFFTAADIKRGLKELRIDLLKSQ